MKAIINSSLFDFDSLKKDHYILFDKTIESVGPMSEFQGADTVYDGRGCVVMPGLVAGHTHIYSTFARGWITPFHPTSFRQLLEQMWWKLDHRLDKEATSISALVSGLEWLKNGITTVIDHHASGQAILGTLDTLKDALCNDLGLRGIFCFETSDRFPIEACIEENLQFSQHKTKDYTGLFGMHASMTLSNQTLEKIAQTPSDLPIHIHVGESKEDQLDSYSNYDKSVIQRLDAYQLLRKNSILSHCIHLEEKDIQCLTDKDLYIALNVTSNMNNGVGLPPYKAFRDAGLNCILGNDGLGYQLTRDMMNFVFTMHHLESSPTDVGLNDLKTIIQQTYAAASTFLGCSLGRLEKGYEADLITLPYLPPTEMTEENAMGHFLYGMCDHFHPREVFSHGELKIDNYRLLFDEARIYKEAQKISKRIWEASP